VRPRERRESGAGSVSFPARPDHQHGPGAIWEFSAFICYRPLVGRANSRRFFASLELGIVGAAICGCGSGAILAALPNPLGSTAALFNPPALAGPCAIPLIGTIPAEPAGRGNPPIAAEPACPPPCPPRANEAAGGVKTMNNAIATFTEVLDMGSASMIHWNGEAVRLTQADTGEEEVVLSK
jgi:hypothetical protein